MGRVSGVYKIINNKNGKIYIGQTVNYRKRKQRHLSSLRRGTHSNLYMQRTWDKHGEGIFSFELLMKCDISELDELECRYIEKYRSLHEDNGYNLVTGGQSYRSFTQEVRQRMSEARKGMKFTAEHRERIGLSQVGKKISKESIALANKTKKEKGIHLGERNPNATISNKTAEKIIYDLIRNVPVNDICEKYDTTSDTVYNIKYNRSFPNVLPDVREDLSVSTKVKFQDKVEMAINLYKNGHSQNEISKKMKMSRNTLRRELKARNIDTAKHKNQFTKLC